MKINIASTRLAFYLIASLLFLVVLSAVIPQQDISRGQILDLSETLGKYYSIIETLKLDRIYYNPVFYVILGLLAINLTAGNIRRFGQIYRSKKSLLRLRYLGSVIFHLSLLLIMMAVILNYLYKSEMVYALTEGQTIGDSRSEYFRQFNGPLAGPEGVQFSLRLDSIIDTKEREDQIGGQAQVTLTSISGLNSQSGGVSANHPMKWGGYEFHYGAVTGYSPELTLTDANQEILFKSFMRVSKRRIDKRESNYDFVLLPQGNGKIAVEVLPSSDQFDFTRYVLELYNNDSLEVTDTVLINEKVSTASHNLFVSRLRYWCYLSAIKNPFLNLVFWGFWLALSGLTVGFIARLKGN